MKLSTPDTRQNRAQAAFGMLRSKGVSMKRAAIATTATAGVMLSNAAFALSTEDTTKVQTALTNHELLVAMIITGLISATLAITGFFLVKKLLGN